jgi:hypothetical protein
MFQETLIAFPSSRHGILASIDCYALDDYAGCVFHMMGLAELGFRAIAKERGIKAVGKNKPIQWGTWQDVFQAIETQLKTIRQTKAGPKRDAALSFYDTALSDLRRDFKAIATRQCTFEPATIREKPTTRCIGSGALCKLSRRN